MCFENVFIVENVQRAIGVSHMSFEDIRLGNLNQP